MVEAEREMFERVWLSTVREGGGGWVGPRPKFWSQTQIWAPDPNFGPRPKFGSQTQIWVRDPMQIRKTQRVFAETSEIRRNTGTDQFLLLRKHCDLQRLHSGSLLGKNPSEPVAQP